MGDEIERKWLLTKEIFDEVLGKYPSIKPKNIFQSYITTEMPEVRLRIEEDEYFLTIKSDAGKSGKKRSEHQINLSREQYHKLLGAIKTNQICKERYEIPLEDGYIAQIDNYQSILSGLFTAEVEFKTEEESNNFKIPEWLAKSKEITGDKRFKNKNLALNGLPKDF